MRPPTLRSPLFALILLAAPWARGDVDPAALLAAQRASTLGSQAWTVENLELDARMATVLLEQGWLFPVVTPDGSATPELVFRGRGRLTFAPSDPIERSQLELFTEAPELDEPFTAAVFVVGDPAVRARLFALPAGAPPAAELAAARADHGRWKDSQERVRMGIPGASWRIGLGETLFDSFFAGLVETEEHGRVLYLIDPEADEQVTLGRFVPLELDRKEERKARRQLHREQRRGRLVGLELEDLGSWDTWVSAHLTTSGPTSGQATFEPRHYDLSAHVAADGKLAGKVEVELTATAGGARTVLFRLPAAATVTAVRDAEGRAAPHAIERESLVVLLPVAPAAGETTRVAIEFSGPLLERYNSREFGGDRFYLPNTVAWYPHAGTIDQATYEVELTSDRGNLVGPGSAAGAEPGRRMRFLLDRPSFGFTFEVDRFKTVTDSTGEIPITLHLADSRHFEPKATEKILGYARGALDYLQAVFGPLPYDRLTMVTTVREYSQSFPGHLVLSEDMLTDYYGWGDPRTLVAHELAHQWWGHLAGFSSYRDQWISEAMANYAAVQYGRDKLNRELIGGSPTSGWQDVLTRLTLAGSPLENVGPLVLGGRLDSSIADGYAPIVYMKGALVVDHLHNMVGPEKFLTALRKILVDPESRELTTAELLRKLEHHGGVDLDELADRFIYGVGLPEIYYSYRFEQKGDGKWAVVGTARQQAPYHYRYRLQPTAGGLPDVVRETVEKAPIGRTSNLAVPVEIGIFQPDAPPPAKKLDRAERKEWEERVAREGNAVMQGRTLLRGAETSFRFEIAHEPRLVWFDRHEEVFTVFYDERRFPKRSTFYRGIDHAAAGRRAEAEAAFRKALTVPLSTDPPPPNPGPFAELITKVVIDQLDRSIRLRLTRLLLDDGRIPQAREALAEARGGDRGRMPVWQKHEERTLEARLALREGDPRRTLELLARGFNRRAIESREGQALRAVAAWATGDAKALADAREAAEKAGVDLSLLDVPRP